MVPPVDVFGRSPYGDVEIAPERDQDTDRDVELGDDRRAVSLDALADEAVVEVALRTQ